MEKITIISLMLGYGGIEKYVSTLANMLSEKYEVQILCLYKSTDVPAFYISKKVKIKYLVNDYLDRVSLKTILSNKQIVKAIKEVIRRIKIKKLSKKSLIINLKNCNSNYIITTRQAHNKIVNKYLKDKNIIKIATEHNYHNNNNKRIKQLVKSVSNFDYFVLVSKELKQYYEKLLIKPKCVYIPNVIEKSSEEKTNLNTKKIISVGRLSSEKGYLDLIDIMRLVVNKDKLIKLYLIGDGFQKEEIKKSIIRNELSNNVILTGFLSEEEMKRHYLDSSLFVMTSYTEAFGIVLLDAMNYGVPCIAFDCASGAKEILSNNIGYLISNRDKNKMANKIIELLNENQRKHDFDEYLKQYSLTENFKLWNKILQSRK